MRTTQEFVDLCTVPEADPLHAAAIGFCFGYIVGASHYYVAEQAGPEAKPLLFSVGFAFDSSPVSTFNRSPSSPFDRNFRYGVGLQYDWSERTAVGLTYECLDAGSGEIKNLTNQAIIRQGHYAPNHIHFIAFNVVKKF